MAKKIDRIKVFMIDYDPTEKASVVCERVVNSWLTEMAEVIEVVSINKNEGCTFVVHYRQTV